MPCSVFQANLSENLDGHKCLPIKASSLLSFTSNTKLSGKFVEKSTEIRKLMTFYKEPHIEMLPQECFKYKDQTKWRLVFFVKTSISNFERRNSIRSTWGAIKIYNSVLIKLVFIVGTNNDYILEKKLSQEANTHKDILQINLLDSKNAVPEKVLAGMQWSRDNVPLDWIYASVDDDVVVYIPNLIDHINTLLQPVLDVESISDDGLKPCYQDLPLVCVYNMQDKDAPNRWYFSKWYTSKEEYSGDVWPTYCRGGLYLMSNKLAAEIYEESRTTPFLTMDDVWITGLMRRKLGFGDCNIMAAPFSEKSDNLFVNYFIDDGGDRALVKHLWGNVWGWSVNVASKLRQEWDSWNTRTKLKVDCRS